MKSFLIGLFIALALQPATATDTTWHWVRVESGIPMPVVQQGSAITLAESPRELSLRLRSSSGSTDFFDVQIARSGKRQASIRFAPPNTLAGTVEIRGVQRSTAVGPGKEFEEFEFLDSSSGHYLLLTRLRSKPSK